MESSSQSSADVAMMPAKPPKLTGKGPAPTPSNGVLFKENSEKKSGSFHWHRVLRTPSKSPFEGPSEEAIVPSRCFRPHCWPDPQAA